MRYLLSILTLCLMPMLAQAQTYPDYMSITVNDFAGFLNTEAEAALDAQLTQLREDTGIEMTVVTLSRQEVYAPDISLEEFSTGLFNYWGVGNAQRNDGIMVLVLPGDRAMRLELGRGFGTEWNDEADSVVQNAFLPLFRENDYAGGIARGVDATIDQIARPFAAGAAAPEASTDGATDGAGGGGFWAALLAIPVLLLVFAQKIIARFRKCPQCGKRGTVKHDDTVLTKATRTSTGEKHRHITCSNCDYNDTALITMSRLTSSTRSSSSSSSFGGGSSSGGGGSSGRW